MPSANRLYDFHKSCSVIVVTHRVKIRLAPVAPGTENRTRGDQLENRLHAMVCSGQIGLKEAQKAISEDWITEYKKVFNTGEPVAFRETSRRRRRRREVTRC